VSRGTLRLRGAPRVFRANDLLYFPCVLFQLFERGNHFTTCLCSPNSPTIHRLLHYLSRQNEQCWRSIMRLALNEFWRHLLEQCTRSPWGNADWICLATASQLSPPAYPLVRAQRGGGAGLQHWSTDSPV